MLEKNSYETWTSQTSYAQKHDNLHFAATL